MLLLLALAAGCARGRLGSAIPGGGGGGGGGGTITPPARASLPPFGPALLSCAAGDGELRADFALPGSGYDAAIFVGTDRANLLATTPRPVAAGSSMLLVPGLALGTEYFVALGVREHGTGDWRQSGLALRARVARPIYVDAAADPQRADGRSPTTAFVELSSALIAAALAGGGNVHVRDGEYASTGLVVFAGTQVCGGFAAGFQLAERDPRAARTVLRGTGGTQLLSVAGGGAEVVLDGLVLEGAGSYPVGLDVDASPLELRSVTVRRFASRGLRLRNTGLAGAPDVTITGASFSENGGDGLSGQGSFDVRVDASVFDANVQEGFDFDDLVADSAQTVDLAITGSRFFGNGAEGIDIDLAAPPFPGAVPGAFRVEIRGCRVESNGLAGLLLDIDYETSPTWRADLQVRECFARANAGDGFHVDADAPVTLALHRVLASGNGGDGIEVSSESAHGLALVTASIAFGNGGAGVRATQGNVPIAISHALAAGNAQGGFVSTAVLSSVSSSITHLQGSPFVGVDASGVVDVTDPALALFAWAPQAYLPVSSQDGATLGLAAAAVPSLGALVELADGDVAMRVTAVQGTRVSVEPAPATARMPALLTVFDAAGRHVVEDFRLATGSVALGRGLAPSGGAPVDPGPFGAPAAAAPGFPLAVAVPLLRVLGIAPAPTEGVPAGDAVQVEFSAPLDPTSLDAARVRVIGASGRVLAAAVSVEGARVRLTPPGGRWPEPFRIELHAGLRGVDARPFATPLVLVMNLR